MIKKNKFGFNQNPTYIPLILLSIIGIIMIYFGLKLNKKNKLYTQQVPFTITKKERSNSITTSLTSRTSTTRYILDGTIDNCKDVITVGDYIHKNIFFGDSQDIKIGDKIFVWIKPNCAGSDAIYDKNNLTGNLMIGLGIFFIIGSIILILKIKKKKLN